jgi:hypothetical protein
MGSLRKRWACQAVGWRTWFVLSLLLALMGSGGLAVMAQGGNSPIEVYVMREPPDAEAGMARLFFVESVSGEAVTVDARGERFTVVGEYVLYEEPETGTIFRAWPDGRTEPHPFIQPEAETERVEWVVSPDGHWVAWTLVNRVAEGFLATVTTLVRADGTESRSLLQDGPDSFLRVMPLALTDEGVFFFDRQPEGIGGFFFYPQYATLHHLLPGADTPERLPFEPNCFCGAGFSPDGGFFARLEQVSDEGGFDVRVWDLAAGVDVFAPSFGPPYYQMAGVPVVSSDGRRVVYSLANGLTIDSAGSGGERFMLAAVDVGAGEQRPALETPLRQPLLPFAWAENDSAVLLYNPRQDGTWKLLVETGEVREVAAGTFLGVIR